MNKLIKKLQSLSKQEWRNTINALKAEHNKLIDLNKLNKAKRLRNKIFKWTNAYNYNKFEWSPNLFDTRTNKFTMVGVW